MKISLNTKCCERPFGCETMEKNHGSIIFEYPTDEWDDTIIAMRIQGDGEKIYILNKEEFRRMVICLL